MTRDGSNLIAEKLSYWGSSSVSRSAQLPPVNDPGGVS